MRSAGFAICVALVLLAATTAAAAAAAAPSIGDVRLAGGPSPRQGQVQVQVDGQWVDAVCQTGGCMPTDVSSAITPADVGSSAIVRHEQGTVFRPRIWFVLNHNRASPHTPAPACTQTMETTTRSGRKSSAASWASQVALSSSFQRTPPCPPAMPPC